MLVAKTAAGTVVSGVAVVPEGARATVLDIPGEFRLDAQLLGDTFRAVVRNPPHTEATVNGSGYSKPVVAHSELGKLRPSAHDLTVTFADGAARREVPIMVGVLRDASTGLVTVAAQARFPSR